MSEKRRDNKGRILKTGESQRTDGRYLYKYIDTLGEAQSIYSWKLVSTDRVPAGKRNCIALRDKVKEIQKDLEDGIDAKGKKMTLCQLYTKQNAQRGNVKRNTLTGRKYLMDILEQDKLGTRAIDTIKPSDAKEWAIRMKENGFAYKTINNYKRSLKASFYTAMQDDYVRKNPFDFALNTVIEDDTKAKEALSEEQEKSLLEFMKNDVAYQRYYDNAILLLKTGLRISEFCGLTVKDIDFENRLINVDHQLLRDTKIGYYIETPKTKSGVRQIPMSEEVIKLFRKVLEKRENTKPINVDGYTDFLFLNQAGYPMTGANYTSTFRKMTVKYNKCHEEQLSSITPHILRHTFCTRLANKNMNPKNLQYVMGHSSINITLNLYAHTSIDGVKSEMTSLIA